MSCGLLSADGVLQQWYYDSRPVVFLLELIEDLRSDCFASESVLR